MTSTQWVALVHATSPLHLTRKQVKKAMPGQSLRELAPATPLPFICILNGDPVLRKDWDRRTLPGDTVIFQILPQGGGGGSNPLRMILTIALMVAVNVFAPGIGAGLSAQLGGAISASAATALVSTAAMIVGGALINAVAPLPQGGSMATPQAPSSVYSVSLQGNAARLEQPIPVHYGKNNTFPDFAAQPYSIFVDNDQYYHACLLIGQGEYEVHDIRIDDTNIDIFEDVEYELIQPGDLASHTLVKTNVLNAPEVAGQDMFTNRPIGPYTLCEPTKQIINIGIDVAFPKGLFLAGNDGNLGPLTITWVVEARIIDNNDNPVNSWTVIGSEVVTEATSTPQRRSYSYAVSPARYQVRVKRTDTRNENQRAAHDAQWIAARSELASTSITNTSATFLMVKIRASEQLSGLSQRKINVVHTRKLPIWDGTSWSAPTATRSIVWAFADVLRSTDYGEGREDKRIDLEGLLALDDVYTDRSDYFDGSFDSRRTILEGLKDIARAGRAIPLPRMGVMSMVRDGPQELPAAIFNNRNIVQGSLSIEYIPFTEESSDGVELSYWDSRKFNWSTIVEPSPGVTTPTKLTKIKLFGVTTAAQAGKEAKFIVANDFYRRKFITFRTEMDAALPSYGDMCALAHDMPGWAIGGQCVAYDADTLTATLSEEVTFVEGQQHYIVLQTSKGGVIGPYLVTQGPEPRQVIFDSAPAEMYVADGRDRTRFNFGVGAAWSQRVKILNIIPKSMTSYEVRCVAEDDRVHTYEGTTGGGGSGARPFYLMEVGTPDYESATEGQRSFGGWLSTSENVMTDGSGPYVLQGS